MSADATTPLARLGRWLFEDRGTGRIVVAQWPNWSLWLFIAASLAAALVPTTSTAHRVLEIVAALALVVWALDEIIRGCNPFRRMLGAAVLVLLAVRWLGA